MASTSSGQDSVVVDGLVNYIKSAGLFDQFRRDCLADVDTKPAYQNLRQRVEGYVSNFLSQHTWSPNLNKNQLRDSLRRQINQSEMLSTGVERIVEQVVEPQIQHVFRPQIEKAFNEYVEKKKGDAESRKDEELPNKTEEISVPMVTSEKVESTCKSELSALPTSTGTKSAIKSLSDKTPADSNTSQTPPSKSVKQVGELSKPLKQVGELSKPAKQVGELGKTVKQSGELGKSPKQLGEPGKPVKQAGELGKLPKQLGEPGKPVKQAGELSKSVKQVGDLGKTVKQAGELGKSPKQLGELGKSPKQLGEPGKPIKNVGDASKPVKQLGDQKKTAAETTKLTETKARLKQGVTKASKKNLGKDVEKSKLKPGVVKLGESRRTEHVPGKTTHVASKTEVHSKDFKSEKLKPDAADKLTGQKSDRSGKVTPKSDKKVITGEKIKTDTKSGEKEKHKLDPIKSRETLDKSKGKEKLVKSKTDAKISKEEKVKPLKCDTDKKMSDDLKARLTTEGKSRQETSSKDKTKDTDVKDKKNVLSKDKVKMKDSSVKLKTDSKKGLISKHSDHVDSSKKDGGVNENKKDKKVEESALSKVKSSKEPAREVKKNRELKGEMKRPLTVTERDDNKCPDESRMESVPKLETTKPKPKQSEIEEDSNCGSVLDSEETNKVSVAMDSTEVKQEKDEDLDAMSDIDDKLSDVTVSSVHTSDLSSFDDELSSVSSSSSEELESEEQDTDLSASTGKSPISNTSGESDSSKKRSSTKALTLNRFYSDSEDDESREERRKKAAKEKEDRLLRRHQMKEEMTERWKQYEEEKRTKREERKKAKQLAKENEEAKRRKKLKKEEKVQAKREQKVLEKKMALRRQRTLNKKYLSSEFTSLFSQKVRSGQFGGEEEEEEEDDEEDIDDDDDEDEEIEEGEEVDFKSKDDGMKEVEDNKTDKTDGTKGNDDSDKTGSDIKPEKGKPGRKKKIIDADDKLPDSFFTSSIPDVGPSYEQTFIAKALELSAYSSGLRRSVRRSSTLSSGVSGSPSSESQEAVAFPPEKCGSTSSSTEMSAVKDVTDGRSVGIPLAGHVQEDLKERESPVTQLKEEDFESPATPTQDEPSFFEDLEEAKSTTSGETIPIFSLPPVGPDLPSIKVQPPSTDVDTSTDVKKEQDCEALGVNLRSLRKAEPPDNTEKSVSTRRRDEPRTRPAKSERKEHSATSERSHDTRQHSEHYLSTSKVGQNPDDRSSARPSYGIRPRRQSSREHYKPMSDQFDYYSGKKAHAKDDYPRRRQPSHTRNSPPRESRSRKRMASPSSQEHRPSKYRGYSSRR